MLSRSIRRGVVVAIALLIAAPLSALAQGDYRYPIVDRWVSTVVGTPSQIKAPLPPADSIPLRKRRVTVFPDRDMPEALWYDGKMLYTVALQKQDAAPVMFLIAGTGASHNGSKNLMMARAFYEQGYHVVSLSSPTWPNFVGSASSTGVPGHVFKDAEDLYRAMEVAWNDARGRRTATSYSLVGYSLGGLNAAFVAHLDSQRKTFDFERVLLINPPVNLYNSISLLDRMIKNIPGGEDNFDVFFNDVMRVFSDIYKREQDDVGFSDDFLVKVFQARQPKDEELAALIGLAFRMSSGSMIFTTDVITDYGFIKPKGYTIDMYESLTPYRQVAYRIGFTDFYHEFFYPFYADEYPGMSRDDFIETMGLSSITDFLREADNIFVMHNMDDVILAPGEINYFPAVFGDRAKIYPWGGHLGNMEYIENVAHMVGVFK
ncbi:MAG: alpha/beta fold hydrolase [Halieaceae bacterium]|nr:alpha/beta fold hydrolase [Halieaceae bacterium]